MFIITIALRPDKQKKAQEKFNKAIGHGRLPVLSDKDSLPYVVALVKVMCWHPIVTLSTYSLSLTALHLPIGSCPGIARRTDSDDVYEGHFILKKNTAVSPHLWSVSTLYAQKLPLMARRTSQVPRDGAEPEVSSRAIHR